MAHPVPLAHLPASPTTHGHPIHPCHSMTIPTVQPLSHPTYDPRNDASTWIGPGIIPVRPRRFTNKPAPTTPHRPARPGGGPFETCTSITLCSTAQTPAGKRTSPGAVRQDTANITWSGRCCNSDVPALPPPPHPVARPPKQTLCVLSPLRLPAPAIVPATDLAPSIGQTGVDAQPHTPFSLESPASFG